MSKKLSKFGIKINQNLQNHVIHEYRKIQISLPGIFNILSNPSFYGKEIDEMKVETWCDKVIALNSGKSFAISIGDEENKSLLIIDQKLGMALALHPSADAGIKEYLDYIVIPGNYTWNVIKKNSTLIYINCLFHGAMGSAGFLSGQYWLGGFFLLSWLFWMWAIFEKQEIIFHNVEVILQGRAAIEEKENKRKFSAEFYYLSEGKISDRIADYIFKQFGRILVGSPLVTSISPVNSWGKLKLSRIYHEYIEEESNFEKLLNQHERAITIRSGIAFLIGSFIIAAVIICLYKYGYGPAIDFSKSPSFYMISFAFIAFILWMILIQTISNILYRNIASSCFVAVLISLYVELNRKTINEFSTERTWIYKMFDDCVFYLNVIKNRSHIENPYEHVKSQFEKIESDLLKYKSYFSIPMIDTNIFIRNKLKRLIKLSIQGRYGEYEGESGEKLLRKGTSLWATIRENFSFGMILCATIGIFILQNYRIIDLSVLGFDIKTINTLLVSFVIVVISTKFKSNVFGFFIEILRGK